MAEKTLNRRTPEFVAEVRRLHASGMPIHAIHKHLKCGVSTVYNSIGKGEATLERRVISADQRIQAHKLRATGATHTMIAEATGLALGSVRHVLLEPPPREATATPGINMPARMTVRIPERVARMRDSFKARGMSHENATREAMRICSGSAAGELGGAGRAAGGVGVSPFHEGVSDERA